MQPLNWDFLERAFIEALAATGNVSEAAKRVGIGRQSAYDHRKDDPVFAALWDDALETATDMLELEARRRAHDGCERPVYHKGTECGRIREYSDALMVFLLKAHRPQRFRENVQHEHAGGLTIKVVYVDRPDSRSRIAEATSGTADDPGQLPTI